MSETRIPYRVVDPQNPVDLFAMQHSKTYSLTLGHVVRVSELADMLHKSEGAVLREAIDLLYEKLVAGAVSAQPNNRTKKESVKKLDRLYR